MLVELSRVPFIPELKLDESHSIRCKKERRTCSQVGMVPTVINCEYFLDEKGIGGVLGEFSRVMLDDEEIITPLDAKGMKEIIYDVTKPIACQSSKRQKPENTRDFECRTIKKGKK